MELEIYLCRHGETEWSLSGKHTGRTDLDLTEEGKNQALGLKKRLEGLSFSAIYSSPLKRASETCLLAGYPDPTFDSRAQEWDYGLYEGLTSDQIYKLNPSWELFSQGAPGGETPQALSQRADALIHNLLQQKGKIILFSHGHFLRVLAARWLGLDASKGKLFALAVASISILGFEHKTQKVLRLWNDTH
jgi:probable phosphoglycerate mutase